MAEVKKSTPSKKKNNLSLVKSQEKSQTRTQAKVKTKEQNQNKPGWHMKEDVLSVVIFMLAVFLFISTRNFQGVPADQQFIGLIGTYLMNSLQLIFGKAALGISVLLLFWAMHIGILKKIWSVRMWGLSLLLLTIMIFLSVYDIPLGVKPWDAGLKGMGGGVIGGAMAFALLRLVGQLGTAILLVLFMVLSLIMILDKPIAVIGLYIWKALKYLQKQINQIMFYQDEPAEGKMETAAIKSEPVIINQPTETIPLLEPVSRPKKPELVLPQIQQPAEPKAAAPKEGPEIVFLGKDEPFEYLKPSLDLLTEVGSERSIDKKNIKESITVLEDTFASFGVSVKVNQVSCGPAVTRYELSPAPGVKISRIISLTDDLQLNLAAPGIRIEAPIPGKASIGIEVPNAKISSVGLRNLLNSNHFRKLNSPLAFALGEDIAGNTMVAKLSDMPHLLIAGSTGSGKSVCLNSIIMSLLYNASPDELKLVFIDPKMVELTVYNGIPHLMTPVVTDPKKAAVILRWMTTEMEKRYKTFADKGVRDIYRYNQTSQEKMPFIVIIIDELADLMMVSPVDVEDSICRLAQMARAAGIHLIVATQRPSVDVVTGIIKANIPSRIAFAVSSQADSRTILDLGGAEKLLGKGDMLFFPVGAVKPYRVQGAYVSDNDIEKTVQFIKDQLPGNEVDRLKDLEVNLDEIDIEADDDMFWEAVTIFVESQKASVSLLQRKLRIGYARAARLVDQMEERGLVSEIDSNKKREILIDKEQLEKLYPNSKIF